MEHFVFLVRQHIAPDLLIQMTVPRCTCQISILRYSAAAFNTDIITWRFHVLPGNLRQIQHAEPSVGRSEPRLQPVTHTQIQG